MEKMSKDNERKLLKALDKAATMSITEQDPNGVLVKVAQEFKLTHPELCRVAEAYNKAKSVAFLKKASSEDRAGDFPLADISKISTSLYGTEKTASEAVIPLRNFADMYIAPEMDKAAADYEDANGKAEWEANKNLLPKEKPKARPQTPRSRASVWKEAMEYYDLQDSVKTVLSNKVRDSRVQRDYELKKVAAYCEHCNPSNLSKIARNIVNGYGIEKGASFIKELNQNMKCNRLPENLDKTAHAVVFPLSESYISISKIAELTTKLDSAKKDLDWFVKEAEDINPASMIKGIGDLGKIINMDAGSPESVDVNTAMPAEYEKFLKELESKRMLYNLYRFDPILQSYPLSDVADSYNEVVATTPALADNKAWMRASLRRMMTQGKAVDPFELKDMLASNKESATGSKLYSERVGNIQEGASKAARPGKSPFSAPKESQGGGKGKQEEEI